jgi:hypothetical protein
LLDRTAHARIDLEVMGVGLGDEQTPDQPVAADLGDEQIVVRFEQEPASVGEQTHATVAGHAVEDLAPNVVGQFVLAVLGKRRHDRLRLHAARRSVPERERGDAVRVDVLG